MGLRKCVVPFISTVLVIFFGLYGMIFVPPVLAAPAEKKPPGLHYVFAHQYLPRELFANPQLALGLALRYDRNKMLETMWNQCRKNVSEAQRDDDSTGLAVTGGTVGPTTAVAVITMPPPREMAAAYYVCVLMSFTPGPDGMPRAGSVTYYTLEKTISLNQLTGGAAAAGQTETAPTILGEWDRKGSHANYGPGPAPDSPDEFVAAVLKLHGRRIR